MPFLTGCLLTSMFFSKQQCLHMIDAYPLHNSSQFDPPPYLVSPDFFCRHLRAGLRIFYLSESPRFGRWSYFFANKKKSILLPGPPPRSRSPQYFWCREPSRSPAFHLPPRTLPAPIFSQGRLSFLSRTPACFSSLTSMFLETVNSRAEFYGPG